MHTIFSTDPDDALRQGFKLLQTAGIQTESRNGPTLTAPFPVCTVTRRPYDRVSLSPIRDANPFFHIFEAVWMLSGRDDVAGPATYAKQMLQYSDDGTSLSGAYGYRWAHTFPYNQLIWAAKRLKNNPTDRRVVISMWDPRTDISAVNRDSKDVPCNTHIYLSIVQGLLDMTVCCRSNDAIWGAHGANAVHFSILHEVLANYLVIPIGTLYQFSNNYHVYLDIFEKKKPMLGEPKLVSRPETIPIVGITDLENFFEQCWIMTSPSTDLELYTPANPWLRDVVRPLLLAHKWFRLWRDGRPRDSGHFGRALLEVDLCADAAWKTAAINWLYRRSAEWTRAQDDGVSYE